jgi:hypothetical protein
MIFLVVFYFFLPLFTVWQSDSWTSAEEYLSVTTGLAPSDAALLRSFSLFYFYFYFYGCVHMTCEPKIFSLPPITSNL